MGMGVGITGIEWAEARDAAKDPTRHRKASSKKTMVQLKVSVVLQLKSPTLWAGNQDGRNDRTDV